MNFITSLNQIAEGFLTSYAWPVFWQTALLVVIITVAAWTLFRKASPQFRYLLWLLVLVRLVLPPAAYLPTGVGNWGRALLDLLPPSARQEQMAGRSGEASPVPMFFQFPDAAISEYESPSKDFAPASTPPTVASLNKPALLLLIWAVGIAGLLSFLLIRLIRFQWLLRGAVLPGETLSRSVADYARRLGMRRDVKMRVTDAPCGPIVCGFLRPVIVLPKRILLELSQEELAPVLIHELAHVKRGDWLVNWLQVLSGILYFFHPFLWYANRQIRQEREKACDDLVLLALGLDRKGYVNSLMRVRDRVVSRMGLLPALVGIVEHRSSLSARILRILDPHTRPAAKLSFLSILTLIAFACCFLTFVAKAQVSGQENPPNPAESQPPSAESQPPSGEERDAPPSSPAKTISGIVKDAKGQPQENADVLLTGDNLEYYGSVSMGSMKTLPDGMFTQIGSMKTGADGTFAFTVPETARAGMAYQIIASKAGHAWAGVRINSTKVVEKSNPVQLTLGEPKALAGQVVNRKGEPVFGALVYPLNRISAYRDRTALRLTLPGMERFAAKTNADGRFRFEQLPADWQPGVAVRHPDYANLSVFPDGKSPIRAGKDGIRLELTAPGSIQGCVMDTATSWPVEGVELVAVDLFAECWSLGIAITGADGRYDFQNLAAGTYYSIGPLSDFEFGDKTRAPEGIVRSRCPVRLKEGEVLDGMDLPMSPGVMLRGRVVDSKTRKGIACMVVGVSQNEGTDGPSWHSRIYTDSEGRFEVMAPGGEIKVRALEVGAHVDDLRYTQVLTLKKGKVPEEVVIALPGMVPNRVKGWVSGPDGWPFAGRATIVPGIGSVPGPIQTDDTGHFDFEIRRPVDLPSAPDMPPDLTLYALVPEKNLAGRVPMYSRSEEAMVWIRLKPGGMVIGRVVDEGKKPIAEARITLHPTATASCGYGVIADADGRFRIPSLCDEVEYQLELTSQGYGSTQIRGIKGAAGQTHDCGDIVLAKGSPGTDAARPGPEKNDWDTSPRLIPRVSNAVTTATVHLQSPHFDLYGDSQQTDPKSGTVTVLGDPVRVSFKGSMASKGTTATCKKVEYGKDPNTKAETLILTGNPVIVAPSKDGKTNRITGAKITIILPVNESGEVQILTEGKTKAETLDSVTFRKAPGENQPEDPASLDSFFNEITGNLNARLYGAESVAAAMKAAQGGRRISVNLQAGTITVVDTFPNVRAASAYLKSLPQLTEVRPRYLLSLKYRAANEKTLAEIEKALGMKPGSIRTSVSGGASGASEQSKDEPVRREDQRAPFSISRVRLSNSIVVTYSDPRDLARVKEVIAQLDRPEVQVEVETLILEVTPQAPVEVRREMEKYLTPDSKIRAAIQSSSPKTSGTLGESDSKIRAAIRSSSSKTSGTLGESAPPTATFLHFWESADPKLREWEKNGYLNFRSGPHMLVINKNSAAFKIEEKKSPRDETAPKTTPKTLLSLEFRPKVEADKRIFFQDVRLEAGSAEAYTAEFKPSLLMDENQYVVVGRLRPQADEPPSCYVLMKAQLIE